jgi:glutathione S-transferase
MGAKESVGCMFTLYTTPLSANGRKVLAVARHLRLATEVKLVNVYRGEGRTPEYLAIAASGKIPTLVEGDFTLSESNAIVQYIAEAHGKFELWSRDARERAEISRWLFWESSEWQPALVKSMAGIVGQKLGLVPAAPPTTVDWSEAGFQRLARLLDAHLEGRRFITGETLTLADFSVAAMLTYARAALFPFDRFANIHEWYARVEKLDAWKATAVAPWV